MKVYYGWYFGYDRVNRPVSYAARSAQEAGEKCLEGLAGEFFIPKPIGEGIHTFARIDRYRVTSVTLWELAEGATLAPVYLGRVA